MKPHKDTNRQKSNHNCEKNLTYVSGRGILSAPKLDIANHCMPAAGSDISCRRQIFRIMVSLN